MFEPTNDKSTSSRRRISARSEETTSTNSLESLDIAQIMYTHDGILLKQATAEFISELNTSGSLSLIKCPTSGRLCVEWRPRDIMITDDESQDQDEWSLVDRIYERRTTVSESQIFNTKCESPSRPKCLRTDLIELKAIEVLSRGQCIRFLKDDVSIQSEYFFQNGNADLFVGALQHLHAIRRLPGHKQIYEILDDDKQKLQKTFAELQIDEIKGSGGWVINMLGAFAKVPDLVTLPHLHRNPRTSTRNDDYEVVLSRRDGDGDKSDDSPSKQLDNSETFKDRLPERRILRRGLPFTEKQWREFQTEDGRVSDPTRIKELIFRGGMEHHLRVEVWKYLLNYYQWSETTAEREERKRKKRGEYYQMKAQWLSMTVTQERNFSGYRDRKCQIEKDVKRTDRTYDFFAGEGNANLEILQEILMTYVMYNFDLGYVQGMSDLLAPILAVQLDEVDAFWCFVGFMNIVFSNFDIDQAGMKQQLLDMNVLLQFCNPELFEYLKTHGSDNMYFCFRWLLVWFKREFCLSDIYELWECLWTGLPCQNFHLFVGIAILDQQKDTIFENNFEFNEILKHINELSSKIDLKRTLELAEAIYYQIKSSECLTNEIRRIIGDELCDSIKEDRENDFEDGFDEIVKDPTPEEQELKQQKLEEACNQSLFLSYY